MNMLVSETDPCPKCGSKLEVVNKTVKRDQSTEDRVRRVIQRFNVCTNDQCDFKETRGGTAYINF